MAKFGWKSFVGGLLVGTVGLELIRSKNADKNFFVPVTTGVLVAKDWVMERIEKVQGRSADVFADAKEKADAYLEKKKAPPCDGCGEARGTDE